MTPEEISSNATTSSAASASKLATETDPIADTAALSDIGSDLERQANNTAQMFSAVFKETCQTRLKRLRGQSVLSLRTTLKSDVNPYLTKQKAELLRDCQTSLRSVIDPSVDGDVDPSSLSLREMTYAFFMETVTEALDVLVCKYTERVTTAIASLEASDAADRLEEVMAKLLKSGDDQVEAPTCA